MNEYSLPKLNYDYTELLPFISKEQLKIHYEKHHNAYVKGSNSIVKSLSESRDKKEILDMKATLKSLSFNLSGHILHSLFWDNLLPTSNGGGPLLDSFLKQKIVEDFGSFEQFQKEFNASALSIEGSGWCALAYDSMLNKLLLVQIEKHNCNLYPNLNIILVLDMWEHAFYIDYKNEKAKYVTNFWSVINWQTVEIRLKEAQITD